MSNLTDFIGRSGLELSNIVMTQRDLDVFLVSDREGVTGSVLGLLIGSTFDEYKHLATMSEVAAVQSAINEVLTSPIAIDAVINSRAAMSGMMSEQAGRVSLFNSPIVQYKIRNSSVALAYLESIKTSLSVNGNASDYLTLTTRNCFMLNHHSSVYNGDTNNKTKNYAYIEDGITGAEMQGAWATTAYENRFMSGLYMLMSSSSTTTGTNYADVVYFD